MITTEKTRYIDALETAKVQRRKAADAVTAAKARAADTAAALEARQAEALTLTKARAAAIASAKPAAVVAVDHKRLLAEVAVEIATVKAQKAAERLAETEAALLDAERAVGQAARGVIDGEMIELAHEFTAALDAALAVGERLRELTLRDGRPTALGAPSDIPSQVAEALARLPEPNPLNVPMNVLRFGNGSSVVWSNRLAVLTAAEAGA